MCGKEEGKRTGLQWRLRKLLAEGNVLVGEKIDGDVNECAAALIQVWCVYVRDEVRGVPQ